MCSDASVESLWSCSNIVVRIDCEVPVAMSALLRVRTRATSNGISVHDGVDEISDVEIDASAAAGD